MEEQIEKLVTMAIEAAEKTGEFVIEQAPDLIQQFLTYHLIEAIIFSIMAIIFMITPFFLWKIAPNDDSLYDTVRMWGKDIPDLYAMFGSIIGLGACVVGGIMFFNNVLAIIKISVAPKIYLIEYFIN